MWRRVSNKDIFSFHSGDKAANTFLCRGFMASPRRWKEESFVDEMQAWQCFARTGRVVDYIRYAQVKGQDADNGPREVQCAAQQGNSAGENTGAHHPGTACGGK